MKLYKLTDENGKTRAGKENELQWGAGVTHTAKGEGTKLCTDGVIHVYDGTHIAILFNPVHARIKNPRLWEAEGEIVAREGQIQCGVKTLTTVREIPVPKITIEQQVKFAILCTLEIENSLSAWLSKRISVQEALKAVTAAQTAAMKKVGISGAAVLLWSRRAEAQIKETGCLSLISVGVARTALAALEAREKLDFNPLIKKLKQFNVLWHEHYFSPFCRDEQFGRFDALDETMHGPCVLDVGRWEIIDYALSRNEAREKAKVLAKKWQPLGPMVQS